MNDDCGLYEQNAHPPRRRPSRYSPNVATSALNSNKVSAYPTTVLATIVAPIFTSTSTWHRSNIAQLAAVVTAAPVIVGATWPRASFTFSWRRLRRALEPSSLRAASDSASAYATAK